ncbi:MAG: phosphoribosylformylglycinamidine synthase subunit PurS [Prevotellaceae bacterium]|jgi:phosphoribosylformylglycinamidine synthase|nr:phosphoribosylformylglycinamidine synthase subunit PurS [Prevotellaceae bacterium]
MKFIAEIDVMPLKALLDPQGKAVGMALTGLGYPCAQNVRIGKHITLEIEAANKEKAMTIVNEICAKVLHNPIMEGFEYDLHEVD